LIGRKDVPNLIKEVEMNKVIGSIVLMLFLGITLCFAQGEEDSITITTYYPSPYGVYGELRLHPHTGQTSTCNSANDRGKLYYDDSAVPNQVYVCRQTETSPDAYDWELLGGGGGGLGTYIGNTTGTYNGAGVGGYSGGDAKCAAEYGEGSRMCMAADFVNGTPNPAQGEAAWYNKFFYSEVAGRASDDCRAWTNSSEFRYGAYWGQYCFLIMGSCSWIGGDYPFTIACDKMLKIACCQE
jgi:hypothetical protein